LMESSMTRVALVDDHPLARRGLQVILEDAGIRVVFAVTAPTDFPAGWAGDVDVVLLDLYHNGGESCFSVIAELQSVTRVLVISASGRPQDVLGAIRFGACGYVTKLAEPSMLVAAVQTVAGGGFALSPQLADFLQSELPGQGNDPRSAAMPPHGTRVRLSPREEQALELIARGLTHAQTASRMGVSRATVDTYVERIRGKLQVGNKAELTRAAMERLDAAR
jgi:two-component system, NarL family, nitrate/nitrite response regulator NarL